MDAAEKFFKKAGSYVGSIYVAGTEIDSFVNKDVLSRKKYHSYRHSAYENLEVMKKLQNLNMSISEFPVYILEKGTVFEIHDFLEKEKISDFFLVKIPANNQQIVFKDWQVGAFFAKKTYVIARESYVNGQGKIIDVEKDVILRFHDRIDSWAKIGIEEFGESLIFGKKFSLDDFLKNN